MNHDYLNYKIKYLQLLVDMTMQQKSICEQNISQYIDFVAFPQNVTTRWRVFLV